MGVPSHCRGLLGSVRGQLTTKGKKFRRIGGGSWRLCALERSGSVAAFGRYLSAKRRRGALGADGRTVPVFCVFSGFPLKH